MYHRLQEDSFYEHKILILYYQYMQNTILLEKREGV